MVAVGSVRPAQLAAWSPAVRAPSGAEVRRICDDRLVGKKLENTWQPGVPLSRTIADVLCAVTAHVASDLGWPAPARVPTIIIESPGDVAFRKQRELGRLLPGSPLLVGAAVSLGDARETMSWDDDVQAMRVTTDVLHDMLRQPLAEFALTVHHELVHESQSRRYPSFLADVRTLSRDQVNARMALLEGHATHFERQARARYGLPADDGADDRPFPRTRGLRAWFQPEPDWKAAQYGAGALLVKAVIAQRPELLERLFEFPELAEVALMPAGKVRVALEPLRAAGIAEPRAVVDYLKSVNPHASSVVVVLV